MMVLLNALYFKSMWATPFQKQNTTNRVFYLENEAGKKSLPMMAQVEKNLPYFENETFSTISKAYGNNAFQMFILLPKEGKMVSDVISLLKNTGWKPYLNSFKGSYDVDLWLPKFEIKFDISLKGILSAMGMPDAFDPEKADFRSMSESATFLGVVKQAASIKVDEEGTVVAVASGGKLISMDALKEQAVFHADHPFVYLIAERSSQAILFAGKYMGN